MGDAVPHAFMNFSIVAAPPSSASSSSVATDAVSSRGTALRLDFSGSARDVGCFRQRFRAPVDISTHRALGVRIHGDASGALLDVQLEDASVPYYRDYYVTIDWTGWRTVELAVPETLRLFTHPGGRFPGSAQKMAMRAFEWRRTLALNVFLTNAKAATVFIGGVEALLESPAMFAPGTTVSVAHTVLALPAGLRGSACAAQVAANATNVTGCADYVECSDVHDASSCRAYDANNWPLALDATRGAVPRGSAPGQGNTELVHGAIDVTFSPSGGGGSGGGARAEITVVERSAETMGPFPTTANP